MDATDRRLKGEQTSERDRKVNDLQTPETDSKASEKVKGGLAGGGDPGKKIL